MAEKKEKEEVLSCSNDTEALDKALKKQYGIDVISPASNIIDKEARVVSISPRIDALTNGGFPEGTFITLSGNSGCGKTTLALHYAAKCQSKEYGEREIYFLNVEGRLKKINLQGIPNLNLEKFHVIGSSKKMILSAQDYLQIAENIIKDIENCVIIIDSYAALSHEKEQTGDVGMSTRGAGGYSILAQFFRQICNIVPLMKSNVIGTNHLMANIGSPYGGLMEKGGTAIPFHSDIRLRAKTFQPWRVGGEDSKIIGQITTWSCLKSALGAGCGEIESYIRYGKGIDELFELISTAKEFGLIEISGAWHYFKYDENQKAHGAEKAYQLLATDEKLRNKLYAKLKEMLVT